jgi:hypothetical protein
VEVIAHEAVREQPPAVGLDDAFEDYEERLSVTVVAEDFGPVGPSRKPVVRGARLFPA